MRFPALCAEPYVFIFDIETTGLCAHDSITVICGIVHSVADEARYEEVTLNLLQIKDDPAAQRAHCEHVCSFLDKAQFLAAYNGIRFDLPFVARWAASLAMPANLAGWTAKTIDFYHLILSHVGVHYKMQRVCEDNNLAVEKSGSGLDAIRWAESGEWDLLEAYCMQDVRVLRALLQQSVANGLHLHVRRSACFPTSVYVLRLVEGYSSCVVRPAPQDPSASGADASDRGLSSFLSSACSAAASDSAQSHAAQAAGL